MKFILSLMIGLLAFPACVAHKTEAQKSNTNTNQYSDVANSNARINKGLRNYQKVLNESLTKETKKVSESDSAASAYKEVDFKNFTYPKINGKGSFNLKNGNFTYENSSECEFHEYNLSNIDYADFTNDGNEEILISIADHSGCASSGVSESFYLYTISDKKLKLLWSLSSGFQSNCGLKHYEIKNSTLSIEVIGRCKLDNHSLRNEDSTADIEAYHLTKLVFGWNSKEFIQIDKTVSEITD